MATPINDDGTCGPEKHLVVLVHGFKSSADACWGPMRRLLASDSALTAEYVFKTFQYKTAVASFSLTARLPHLHEIASELHDYLEGELVRDDGNDAYIDTTLVGHSMGGLVIQGYLSQCLRARRGRKLDRLRQAIFVATPNFGSEFLRMPRKLLALLISNPQEGSLQPLADEVRDIHHDIRKRVVNAQSRDDGSYPLPLFCFWGNEDDIVPELSARGHIPEGRGLPGEHSTLIQPKSHADENYKTFVRHLTQPQGHSRIWEVESFSWNAKVAPLHNGTAVVAKYGTNSRKVFADNYAQVERKIHFASTNECSEPFILKYGTMSNGWILPNVPNNSTMSAENLRIYEENGTQVTREVRPEPDLVSTLQMEVYKGFDVGERNFHMHVGKKAFFKKLNFEVDLTQYLLAGWTIREGPQLYFHPTEFDDHSSCKKRTKRAMLDPDPVGEYRSSGIWRWSLDCIREGVIDIRWDVAPPDASDVSVRPSAVKLRGGEHAIFGYGSLLSVPSLERTLGREYRGPFVPCSLAGWRRTWDVFMPNPTPKANWAYQNAQGVAVTPERILYLNIARRKSAKINGVLFVVTDEELKMLEGREWIYNRLGVADSLRGVTVFNGPVWAFAGKSEYCMVHPSNPAIAAVRRSYLDILDAGLRELDANFVEEFQASTDPVPHHLVVQDYSLKSSISS